MNIERLTKVLLIVMGFAAALGQAALASTYCSGPPASAAIIQGCINATPVNGQLELQPGSYHVDGPIVIDKPMTLTTYGRANTGPACFDGNSNVDWTCAVLVADANLYVQGGMLQLKAANIIIDHIVVHGNVDQRLNSAARQACLSDNTYGMNIRCATACDNVTFRNGVSTSALCGTGFNLYGNNPNVNNSMFSYNGKGDGSGPRSDGLSINPCKDGQTDATCPASGLIYNNYFFSNTDIDLIAFSGPGLRIQSNHFHHHTSPATSGLGVIMLDNFHRNDWAYGNFLGADVSSNIINCFGYCDFGIVLGGHEWYLLQPSLPPCPGGFGAPYVCQDAEPVINTFGGSIHDNQINGAKQGIVADGIGRANWMRPSTCNDSTLNCAVRLWNNAVTGTFGSNVFTCGGGNLTLATSPLNVRSGSFGDETTVVCWGPNCISSEVPPAGTTFNKWHGCW